MIKIYNDKNDALLTVIHDLIIR